MSIKRKMTNFPWKKLSLGLLLTCLILSLVGALVLSIVLAWISRSLPDPNSLIERDIPQTTKIYDRTGQHILREIHGEENRTLIQIKDLPDYVSHASVAIEDKNFYTHHGISWRGLIRAFVINTIKGERVKGTSTLTQQLIKNAVLTNERSLTRKAKEILLSLQIERVFTKEQILQLYLNEISYGPMVYGIESAARTYFGKSAKELTLDEAALLAAIPQAPDLYSPYGTGTRGDNRNLLVGRQHYILDQMAEQKYITEDEAEAAKKIETLKKLIARKELNISAPHFVHYVQSQLYEKYGQANVERKGYKVITTLDWDKQQIAEEEVKKGVDERGHKYGFNNGGLVALDPKNGQILSMVGSKDFSDREIEGEVNVTLSPLQPGSSFKPIVYVAAFQKGYTPDMTLWDVDTTFKTDIGNYEPKNYDFKEHGPISARAALQGSLNIPAVKMLYLTGISRVLDFAEQLGYTTFSDRSRFGLSLVLGGGEVRLIEHTNAYAAFANEGKQYPLVSILKVEDANGKIIDEWKLGEGKQVVDRDASLRLTDVLSDNNARSYVFGNKNFLTLPGRSVAAKTGTTNNFKDAWTMGYTPSLVAGVWVGNTNGTEMKRGADGSQIAAPIWQAFMKRALENSPAEKFTPPPTIDTDKPILNGKVTEIKINIDKVSGKIATENTPPDLIEEKTFHEGHNELWYLDKDDPRGPAPTHPQDDPQFTEWENGVQTWITKNNWNTTSTPPTEIDDLHTTDTKPVISIWNPTQNDSWTSRKGNISVNVTAKRRIIRIEASVDSTLIGSLNQEPWNIPVQLPNTLERGFHDITVTAIDDVGNRGSAVVTINVNADSDPISAIIQSPKDNSTININSLPIPVEIIANQIAGVKKIDLYAQSIDGSTRLISSDIAPQNPVLTLQWTSNLGIGTYSVFTVITDMNGNTHLGPSIKLKFINE
ncbi:PBP1A family penicillin-binding protein [Candidatus Uhrbacteria bacterium]|nr:PBP1A family penicillin-binding protein [Candidatus Uhrbacteria bacterium]